MTKMKQGWECPRCGAVMSPRIDCCVNCRGGIKQRKSKPKEIENVFQPIPLAVFRGYTKIGTIYPKGETVNGVKLTENTAIPTKDKYAREVRKSMKEIWG